MDRIKVERAIDGLAEWQKHVQTNSDIDRDISTAIEALKAQLSPEGTTSDTISKTETVEHLRRVLESTVSNTDYDEGFIDGVEFGISTVSTMPTVQPQSTTGQLNDGAQSTARSTDLIDRQAAIDAVDAIGHIATMPDGDKCIRRSAVKYTLSMLPPAQPEQHEGHWIQYDKRFPWRHHYKCSECGNYLDFTGVNGGRGEANYCPNCGAKMKGAQNG